MLCISIGLVSSVSDLISLSVLKTVIINCIPYNILFKNNNQANACSLCLHNSYIRNRCMHEEHTASIISGVCILFLVLVNLSIVTIHPITVIIDVIIKDQQ